MNNCSFIGHVHKSPEIKYTTTGVPHCRLMIKVPSHQGFTFVPIQAWRDIAESIRDLTEGTLVSVVASYQTSSYEKDGQKVYTHNFNASRIDILS
jgi:single-stranded DNA-binding protein